MLRAITDEIMYALMELSGQEYVDEYAQQAKNRLRPGGGSRRATAPAGGTGTGGGRSRRTGGPPSPSAR